MPGPGRHFLQIPGPTNVPDRILRAIERPTIDHRGAEFGEFALKLLSSIKTVFKCSGPVFIYPASGTGAWEAALTNALSPGDKVLMYETGHFASQWKTMADRLGLAPTFIASDWRSGVDPERIRDHLARDTAHAIEAVCVVHCETSTGCNSLVSDVADAIVDTAHPALLMVDVVSSLAAADFRQDEWRVDIAVSGSQKGLMLPPGLGFNAVSEKALEASKSARLPRSFFSWGEMVAPNASGYFPYTPATNLLYGLAEAIDMLHEEGLDAVFARHARHSEATRRAVAAWGLETVCQNREHYANSLTGVMMPEGHSADAFRKLVAETFNMSLGNGLAKLADRAFRIGHLGDFNDLMLAGTLSGVEMGLELAGVPHRRGGVQAALDYMSAGSQSAAA
jgi:alanine-glyoxylate transaminase/serine-glyoxylate transaminase/serine-pyruvate transaminase